MSSYQSTCRLCHGADRAVNRPAVPSLVDVRIATARDQIRAVVSARTRSHAGLIQVVRCGSRFSLAYLSHPERAPVLPRTTFRLRSRPQPRRPPPPEKLRYRSSFGFMFTSSGLPAIAPPWTTLTAYDLNQGTIEWQVPLGEVPELAARGIKDTGSHFPKVGPVVTAGGLIFTGTRDRKVRALDSATGKVLWEAEVEAALEGMPAVYEIDGREYVVFCAAAQATTHTHDLPGHPALQAPIPGLMSRLRCLPHEQPIDGPPPCLPVNVRRRIVLSRALADLIMARLRTWT